MFQNANKIQKIFLSVFFGLFIPLIVILAVVYFNRPSPVSAPQSIYSLRNNQTGQILYVKGDDLLQYDSTMYQQYLDDNYAYEHYQENYKNWQIGLWTTFLTIVIMGALTFVLYRLWADKKHEPK